MRAAGFRRRKLPSETRNLVKIVAFESPIDLQRGQMRLFQEAAMFFEVPARRADREPSFSLKTLPYQTRGQRF